MTQRMLRCMLMESEVSFGWPCLIVIVEINGAFDGEVVAVYESGVFLHVEEIIYDGAVDGFFEELLTLENLVVATCDAVLVGIADELLNEVLATEIAYELVGGVEALKCERLASV